MCNACTIAVDQNSIEDFGGKLVDVINHAGLAMMISVAHRTGLFDAMADCGSATISQLAVKSGLNGRYVKECLGALVTGEVVSFEPDNQTYSLPENHAALLTRQAEPNNFASTMQWVSVLGEVESHIVDCFKYGGGVPYSAYSRFHEVMAEESSQTVVASLLNNIIPLKDGLKESLERGIDVLDVGCGSGQAMLALAKEFPNSRFCGYDICKETVTAANELSSKVGLSNVNFEQKDVSRLIDEPADQYDWVTAFDAIHDQAKPDEVLKGIAHVVSPAGLFLMQDIAASSRVEQNMSRPLAPFLYTISCMHCMSVSLEQGGMGLGAVWGKELACEMLDQAGFRSVKVKELEHDILNFYYLAELN